MTDELFDGLNRLASSTSVPAGTLLFRRDEPSSAFTSSAVARSLCSGRRRKRRIPWKLSLRGASSAFVLPSMGTYSSTAKALTDSELGFISSDRVLEAREQACALPGSHAHHESGSRKDAIVHRGALYPHRGIANAGPLMRRAEETPWAQPRRGRSAGYRRLLQDCLSNTRCITR